MALPDTCTPTTSCEDEKENDSPIESNAFCKDFTKEKTYDLQPVSPFSSGEGLPYAPQGWPNPGDVWGWKVVRRRTTKAGYFCERHLYLPKSLQNPSHRMRCFRSKHDVEQYIESNFPNMGIETFFDLFSWQIPSTEKTPTKVVESLPVTPSPVKSLETGEDATVQRKLKRKTQICTEPTRKSSRLLHVGPRLAPDQDANDIIDLCNSAHDQDANDITDLCHLNEETIIDATENLKGISDSEEGSRIMQNTSGEKKYPNVTVIENFHDFLDTLEDMLVMPDTEASPISDHVAQPATTTLDNEMESLECCKKKLSSLLAIDFPSLVSCNDVAQIATLASQIRKDPTLSVDQLAQLKLVEQIPLLSEAFLEAKGNIEEADKFLGDLEAKKRKVLGLKNDYKDKVAHIESEMDKSSSAIREIDDQVRQLQSKRNEISSALETMQKMKVELTSGEPDVANSVLTLVREVRLGLSEKSKWELKKANYSQRVAEIQEKFITLKGLTF